ncbi:transporter [Rhodoblastus sp.]|uniref:transporter n=1 Tax=Rhodoblastus sp. TaxID=1962975 RepID=UPI003F9C2BA6
MNTKSKVIGAAVGALSLCGLSTAAFAFPQTPPSERVGLDLATPLPEGVYFVDIASIGGYQLAGRNANGTSFSEGSAFNYNVPVVAWSTPWSFSGIHLTLLAALPEAEVGTYTSRYVPSSSSYSYGLYTPFLAAQFGYNFGNGFGLSYTAGVYLPMSGTAGFDPLFETTTFHQMLALAYHANGWNLTGNFLYNMASNTSGTGPVFGGGDGLCRAAFGAGYYGTCQGLLGDDFIYSLAVTKTLGKWEVGIVGYGFTDTSTTAINTIYGGKQSSFALGGLVGYNFGPVITQLIIGSDVATSNMTTKDTRGTLHVIIPLWNPETPKVVTAKY